MNVISVLTLITIYICFLSSCLVSASPLFLRQADTKGKWDIVGDSQVAAMHIVPVNHKEIVIIDKIEVNKIKQANGNPAISAVYNIETNDVKALNLQSDTFCSAGSFYGNGTLLHAGGAEAGQGYNLGYQTVRFLTPTGPNYDWSEIPNGLAKSRWYPAMASMPSGNVLILGGSTKGTGKNNDALNNPTYEIWTIGGAPQPQVVDFPFLVTAMPYNLYPFLQFLPNDQNAQIAFVFANTKGIVFDFGTGKTVTTLPDLPGGIRSYPLTGNAILLPLKPALNYKPVMMICGGNTVQEITSPAIASCGRIDPTETGAQWEMDNFGGTGRIMPDAVFLPDATVLYVNGAGTGFAGFHTGSKANPLYVHDNPVLTPFIYDPETKKWTTDLAPSTVPRMYHSVATLVSDGRVFVTGSNPQGNVELGTKYPTEYRVEMFTPPYLQTGLGQPVINSVAGMTTLNTDRIPVTYGQQVEIKLTRGQTSSSFNVALIHHGFTTHSQSFSRRYVQLEIVSSTFDPNSQNDITLITKMPPNPTILPAGPCYLYVTDNGIPGTFSVSMTLTTNT